MPIAHGPAPTGSGRAAWFVICAAPPGPALWPAGTQAIRPWSEAELVARLLRPAAAALAALQAQHLTHRAVRPDNLFADPADGESLALGCAWAGPPAALQPAAFEPPYVAMCPPAARGEGTIADDIYALGVTLLALALGRLPLAGLGDAAVVQRKLELGCFQALAGDARLPPMIADLVSGMLAQDPQHRPPPALLADPAAVRTRRVAARPPRRASRSLEVGGVAAWEARTLAYALARQPEQGMRMLRLGVVEHWLRRVLGDTTLAAKLEEAQRQRAAEAVGEDGVADLRLAMRAVALLDPLAPLCWNGLAVWPDGLGPALVAEQAGKPDLAMRGKVEQIIAAEATVAWLALRADEGKAAALRQEARHGWVLLRQQTWSGGPLRLAYALNPLLPCRSALLAATPVARLSELLPALEVAAARPEARALPPIDRDLAAFIAARHDAGSERELTALGEAGSPARAALLQLSVLAQLQREQRSGPLPGVAAWLVAAAAPALDNWRNRERRLDRQAALAAAVPAGDLSALLGILEDPPSLAADEQGYAEAAAAVRRIDAKLAEVAEATPARREAGLRLGQEIAAVIGLAAAMACAIAAAVG
jgi:hypothetical protein